MTHARRLAKAHDGSNLDARTKRLTRTAFVDTIGFMFYTVPAIVIRATFGCSRISHFPRKIWRHYKNAKDWKKLIDELDQFLAQKGLQQREPIEPFDVERLKLVAIDFVS